MFNLKQKFKKKTTTILQGLNETNEVVYLTSLASNIKKNHF